VQYAERELIFSNATNLLNLAVNIVLRAFKKSNCKIEFNVKCFSKTKSMIFRNKNLHFDPKKCNLKIGHEILERIGTDSTNKYFKFVGLKIDEFLNWDYQIEHVSNKIASSIFALNQIKNMLQLNIRLLVYNALVLGHILSMEL